MRIKRGVENHEGNHEYVSTYRFLFPEFEQIALHHFSNLEEKNNLKIHFLRKFHKKVNVNGFL